MQKVFIRGEESKKIAAASMECLDIFKKNDLSYAQAMKCMDMSIQVLKIKIKDCRLGDIDFINTFCEVGDSTKA